MKGLFLTPKELYFTNLFSPPPKKTTLMFCNIYRNTPLDAANLQSCILYIYSRNIGTKYFKHGVYSLFFLFKIQFVS